MDASCAGVKESSPPVAIATAGGTRRGEDIGEEDSAMVE
jgi:hypothetical protein